MESLVTDKQAIGVVVVGGIAAYLVFRNRAALPFLGPPEDDGGTLTPSVTTYEGFDLSEYGGPTSYPTPIVRFAQAIAKQEGFYVAGSIPQRYNNPGDLKTNGSSITQYSSADEGWNALYRQLFLILTGGSAHYNLDMSIEEMSRVWTATQQGPWAANVSAYLGVSPDAKLWEVMT